MFFLEIAMLNGRAEQDFCTLARDECADPLLVFIFCDCELLTLQLNHPECQLTNILLFA